MSNKLNKIKQVHGKQETYEVNSLDQVWGDTGISKYGTFDAEEYRTQLSEMSKADLRAHATKVGIVPVDNRELLTKSLMREFNRHSLSYKRPIVPKKKERPLTKEVLDILAEGK